MKNYYILLPLMPTNIIQVYAFVEKEKSNFENVGNNNILLPIMHPNNAACLCYQVELKQSLVDFYKEQLVAMQAEIYESAEAYLLQYPLSQLENEIN
jgi:hypothetical protein